MTWGRNCPRPPPRAEEKGGTLDTQKKKKQREKEYIDLYGVATP